MSHKYADIIIDISHEAIDRTFQYKIPETLAAEIGIGTKVSIPFGRGNHLRTGYVISFSDKPKFHEEKLKDIDSICENGVAIEGELIELAAYMKEQYGSTMINALKTVMPIKEKVRGLVHKEVCLLPDRQICEERCAQYQKKNAKAKLRLLQELMQERVIPYELVTGKLNISSPTLKAMEKEGTIAIEEEGYYRTIFEGDGKKAENRCEGMTEENSQREMPNEQQQAVIDRILTDYASGKRDTYLLKGVTGSGKTLVYLNVIEKVVAMGKQAIVLIPEIALTYQTVKRFRQRFGNKVTIMNSKLSKGERFDQFERAKNGDVSVMIGPRSALFTPFSNLGVIVIDEEHETSYKSEYPPKYHAREIAIERARMAGAFVILGSATPSVESYYHAMRGEYQLLTLTERAKENASMAEVSVVDLREELKQGNRSIFSRHLKELMADRLKKKEQTMLFINRRGFAGFVSCRSCGYVFECPHCDVSLTEHYPGTVKAKLVCHYCGYEIAKPKVCPKCSSPYIAGFGIGTQKVEEQVRVLFPEARVLRMDADTTKNKNSYEQILSKFANGEVDILVGTQMIVKGHDFANVTLVGMIAADLTMFDNDFRSAERTFDLLTQAAGRAGRGELRGEVVIQTYAPEHYCIETAAKQDYESFYEEEKAYRSLMSYPPFGHMLAIFMEADCYELTVRISILLKELVEKLPEEQQVQVVGPCDATITRMNDRYRRVLYLKHAENARLIWIKNQMEQYLEDNALNKECYITFDFNPLTAY